MTNRAQKIHEGVRYYSLPTAAKLLGVSVQALKKLIEPKKIEYRNFRVNGSLWVDAEGIDALAKKKSLGS